MAWTIPDKGEGAHDNQSILFQEDLDTLMAGLMGTDCVLNGGLVTAQGSPNMTVAVAKAGVLSNGTLFSVAANASVTIGAADGTNPRIDLVVIDSAGAIAVRAGTAAAAPKPPARTANDVVLAHVYVPANDTTIASNQIIDKRVMRGGGVTGGGGAPFTLKKYTTAVVFNNTNAIQTYFTVTLPSGLFLAGQTMRVRCGGTMLLNSGTPTVRLVISYGGTTMFSDISAASTADTDRNSWDLDLTLSAQANNDQSLNGFVATGIIAAKTAPTTGIGDAWSTAANVNSINGSAAVDSDAGNRDFTVQFTMSTANAANEITMEYGYCELI
jgi:hypothetical protein